MRWFGPSWNAPVCFVADSVAVPVGRLCHSCDRPIDYQALGLLITQQPDLLEPETEQVWHLTCYRRYLFGPTR